MNKTASKLLHRYASFSEQDIRNLKKWWNTLNWKEKTVERERMEAEMGSESDVAKTESEQEA